MAKYTLVVGGFTKALGETSEEKAKEDARTEAEKYGGSGVSVKLLEQTPDKGAVNVAFD
jgi:hypothetical protein